MHRGYTRSVPELFDLILEHKFFALQFDQPDIVARRADALMFDFFFQRLVAADKFLKVALHGHWLLPAAFSDANHDTDRRVREGLSPGQRDQFLWRMVYDPRRRALPAAHPAFILAREMRTARRRGVMATRLTPEERSAFMLEIEKLRQEHRDLDAAIGALHMVGTVDQLQVQRLKKRKLVLRDRLSYLEDQVTPDIIA